MTKLSSVLRSTHDGYSHYCPACESLHYIRTKGAHAWEFNYRVESPSFNPSVKVEYNGQDADTRPAYRDGHRAPSRVCHYFLIHGELLFCTDCTHEMAGKRVKLPDIPHDGYEDFE